MKALSKLQSSIIVQSAQVDEVAAAMNARAKEFIAVGALVALAMAAGQAKAQQGPITPSNCAAVGATIGGVAGGALGDSSAGRIIKGAIGALGGAAAGHWLCDRQGRAQDASYQKAEAYGVASSDVGMVGPSATSKTPLSFTERERLDAMSKEAIDAKYAWKMALWNVAQADTRAGTAAREAAREAEAEARQKFVAKRDAFAATVARLNQGTDSMAPRAVGRYLEVSAALLELDANARTSYQLIAARDDQLKARSKAYSDEADRAAALRNRS